MPYTLHCHEMRKLWVHVLSCHDLACAYPRCFASRELLKHYHCCRDTDCPVCEPVRAVVQGRSMPPPGIGGAQA